MCPGAAAVVTVAIAVPTIVPRRTPVELAVPPANRLRRVVELLVSPTTVLGIRNAMVRVNLQALAATVAAAIVAVIVVVEAEAAVVKEDSDRLEMVELTALATTDIENNVTGVLDPISI